MLVYQGKDSSTNLAKSVTHPQSVKIPPEFLAAWQHWFAALPQWYSILQLRISSLQSVAVFADNPAVIIAIR